MLPHCLRVLTVGFASSDSNMQTANRQFQSEHKTPSRSENEKRSTSGKERGVPRSVDAGMERALILEVVALTAAAARDDGIEKPGNRPGNR